MDELYQNIWTIIVSQGEDELLLWHWERMNYGWTIEMNYYWSICCCWKSRSHQGRTEQGRLSRNITRLRAFLWVWDCVHLYEFVIVCIFMSLRLRAIRYFPKLFFCECYLQPGSFCCCRKGCKRWKVLFYIPTFLRRPGIQKLKRS